MQTTNNIVGLKAYAVKLLAPTSGHGGTTQPGTYDIAFISGVAIFGLHGGDDWNRDQVQIQITDNSAGRWSSDSFASFSAWITSSAVYRADPGGVAVDEFQRFDLIDGRPAITCAVARRYK